MTDEPLEGPLKTFFHILVTCLKAIIGDTTQKVGIKSLKKNKTDEKTNKLIVTRT